MSNRSRVVGLSVAVIVAAAVGVIIWVRAGSSQPVTLEGAVLSRERPANKEQPVSDAEIAVTGGLTFREARSDASGFFRLTLPRGIKRGRAILLEFRHPGYRPLGMKVLAGKELCIARMQPIPPKSKSHAGSGPPDVVVSNVTVRYSVKTTTDVDAGSVAKTFQVVNTGNVPCHGRPPCSPDGKWKAAIGLVTLEAEEGNLFGNPRVSCIAGPCPFTKIVSSRLSDGGRKISVSARNWSDTATFLVEAEVVHRMTGDRVRRSYPVIFGRTLNFTVPVSAEGVCIEAEINKDPIVFPLGPDLLLRWASCIVRTAGGQTRAYRCEIKPGFRFHEG